jgi:predicted nuclease of restriction endonuclease-like RecB superfamily
MLPSDLLISRQKGEALSPKQLKIDHTAIALAAELINCMQGAIGQTQGELDRRLAVLEGDNPNYRIQRGFAHLLKNHFATFEIVSPLDPPLLRERIFAASSESLPLPSHRLATLTQVADRLSQDLQREVAIAELERGLYADLPENRILTQFEPPDPAALIHRYNLSQVQGIFYRAQELVLHAYRNDPGEYKLLFRYLKLFQLMAYIEGDADTGFTITIDGATSLFKPSTRYGLSIAKMIPALLHVSRWQLEAKLVSRDSYGESTKIGRYALDDRCGLVSHYPPGKPFDSLLESSFAGRWAKEKTDWRLEREVDLIPIPGSVMIPDFRLVHPDGRDCLLEIVGYWRPEYLQKKFAQVRRSEVKNLILAISERLNLEKAGVKVQDLPIPIIWFKDKLSPKAVLQVLESDRLSV